MANTKIAYLLGAGASALTLPTLNELGAEMQNMKDFCGSFDVRSHPGVASFIGQLDYLVNMSNG